MEFARKQLEKYGWTDGKGLGKHENGISQALRPKLKRSMTGVGHNAASDFTEHWWSTLYNKAASNIEVKEKDGKTKKIQAKDEFEITNNAWKLKRRKSKPSDSKPQEQYEDFFVRTAVLGSGGSRIERIKQPESESDDEPMQTDVFKITDEELFVACEGRTAHKGARHGVKALGKLARIEQQEILLLQQSRFNGYSHVNKHTESTEYDQQIVENTSLNCEEVTELKKKKKRKKHCMKAEIYECQIEESDPFVNSSSKKQKKKNKNRSNCDIGELSDSNIMCDGSTDRKAVRADEPVQGKVKKKKPNSIDEERNGAKMKNMKIDLQSDVIIDKKRKKKKRLDLLDRENCDIDVIDSSKDS